MATIVNEHQSNNNNNNTENNQTNSNSTQTFQQTNANNKLKIVRRKQLAKSVSLDSASQQQQQQQQHQQLQLTAASLQRDRFQCNELRSPCNCCLQAAPASPCCSSVIERRKLQRRPYSFTIAQPLIHQTLASSNNKELTDDYDGDDDGVTSDTMDDICDDDDDDNQDFNDNTGYYSMPISNCEKFPTCSNYLCKCRRVELRACRKLIEAQSTQAQTLLSQLRDQKSKIASYEQLCVRQSKTCAQMSLAMQELRERESELKATRDSLRASLLSQSSQINELNGKCALLDSQLRARDVRIEALCSQLAAFKIAEAASKQQEQNNKQQDIDKNSIVNSTHIKQQQQQAQPSLSFIGKLRRLKTVTTVAGLRKLTTDAPTTTLASLKMQFSSSSSSSRRKSTSDELSANNNKHLNAEQATNFLFKLGLGNYASECSKWLNLSNENCLENASSNTLQKQLKIENKFHLKKLILAINDELITTGDLNDNVPIERREKRAKFDYLQVARWLDAIGLSQFKDSFIDARIDARMLNKLTFDELKLLGCTQKLYVSSLRASIKLLNKIEFDLSKLKSRSSLSTKTTTTMNDNNNSNNSIPLPKSTNELALWTNARLVEWLRHIDFSEYIKPTIRFTGLNGALIAYEKKFTAESLASLLQIPTSKLLIRKHLRNAFEALLCDEQLARVKRTVPTYARLEAPSDTIPKQRLKAPGKLSLRVVLSNKFSNSDSGSDSNSEKRL